MYKYTENIKTLLGKNKDKVSVETYHVLGLEEYNRKKTPPTFAMLPEIMSVLISEEKTISGVNFSVVTQQGGKHRYDIYRLVR